MVKSYVSTAEAANDERGEVCIAGLLYHIGCISVGFWNTDKGIFGCVNFLCPFEKLVIRAEDLERIGLALASKLVEDLPLQSRSQAPQPP